MIAAYLGPEGSYSSVASRNVLPFAQGRAYRSFDEVFRAVECKEADYAVIPLENSIEGNVNVNLDLLFCSSLKIVGEWDQPIDNRVFKLKTAKAIKTIYSHPQAYNQSRRHLSELYPDADFIPTASTTEALQKLTDDSVAIAGAYHEPGDRLSVSGPVSDRENNVTRFVVLSRTEKPLGEPNKISVIFEASNTPGGLVRVLRVLEAHGLDMISIQSRPHKTALGRYVFYVDALGSVADPDTARAMEEMAEQATFFKMLGNYQAADSEADQHG